MERKDKTRHGFNPIIHRLKPSRFPSISFPDLKAAAFREFVEKVESLPACGVRVGLRAKQGEIGRELNNLFNSSMQRAFRGSWCKGLRIATRFISWPARKQRGEGFSPTILGLKPSRPPSFSFPDLKVGAF
jgi:hypothetical protein